MLQRNTGLGTLQMLNNGTVFRSCGTIVRNFATLTNFSKKPTVKNWDKHFIAPKKENCF